MGKTLTISPRTKPKRRARRPAPKRGRGRGWLVAVPLVVVAALLARALVVQGYRVPSRSMEDSLLLGEYVLVDKLTYGPLIPFTSVRLPGPGAPERGDVVVLRHPQDPERIYIKRCVALGGQVVEVRDKVVYADDVRIIDPPYSKYLDPRILPGSVSPRDNYGPVRVPEDAVFVVGDSRDNSRDSRHWGAVPASHLVGRAVRIYWSTEALYGVGAAPPRRARVWPWLRTLPWRVRWERLGARVP